MAWYAELKRRKWYRINSVDMIQIYRKKLYDDYPLPSLVKYIAEEIEEMGLQLNPEFQRGHVWNEKQQIAWLEYHLRGGKSGNTIYLNNPFWHSNRQPSKNNGYNVSLGGNDYTHLGNIVELYDCQGNYVCEYANAMEVAKALNVFYGTVYQVIYGIRLSVKGYQLKLKNDNKQIKTYKNGQGGKIKVCNLNDNNEKLEEFDSIADAARKLNLDSSYITKCCKGKLLHHGGFKWRYIDEVVNE